MPRSPLLSRVSLLAAAVLLAASLAHSADGDLDLSFGAGSFRFGYRTTPPSRCAVLRQPDGALLVAGYGLDGAGPFLARFDAQGTLDPSFSGGIVPAGPGSSVAGVDLALQPNGKILLAVAHTDLSSEAFVMRFDGAGNPDLSFGTMGIATSGISAPWGGSVAVAASQAGHGNVYLAAHDFGDGVSVVRFDSTGVRGPAFGGSGVAHPDFRGDPDAGLDLALASGILLAGFDDWTGETCVARLTWSGLADTTFGAGGTGTADTGVHTVPYADVALDVLPDGRILVAGYDLNGARDYVFRFDANGSPDPAFGTAGFAPGAPAADPTCKLDLAALPDGGVALAGIDEAAGRSTHLAVFDAAGTPAAEYGAAGTFSIPMWRDAFADVALLAQPDGALVVAGTDDVVSRLFVARFVAPGIRDDTFRAEGLVRSDLPTDALSGRSLAIQGDGAVLLASYHQPQDAVHVQRFDATGLRDPDFGSHGLTVLSGIQPVLTSSIVILTEPRTHRKYLGTYDSNQNKHCILRLDSSGSLDSTWGTQGIAYAPLSVSSSALMDLALQADGKVLVAINRGGSAGIRMTRFDTTGVTDVTFGGGMVSPGWPTIASSRVAVVCAPEGSVYVAAFDATLGRTRVARYGSGGVLDAGFGTAGLADPGVPGTYALDLALGPGLLLAGIDAGTYRPYVARFLPAGTLDPAFGGGGTGLASTGFEVDAAGQVALAAETDGWVYLAGHRLSGDFVARFTPAGALDPGFGTGGIATASGWSDAATIRDLALQGDGKVVLAGNLEDPIVGEGDVLLRFEATPYAATGVPWREGGTPLALGPCSPNPFRQGTSVRFSLSAAGRVRVTVHDVRGARVRTLVDGARPAGSHALHWSGDDGLGRSVASGIYFLRLESEGEVRTRKLVRVRD